MSVQPEQMRQFAQEHPDLLETLRYEAHELIGEIAECDDPEPCDLVYAAMVRVREAILAVDLDWQEVAIAAVLDGR